MNEAIQPNFGNNFEHGEMLGSLEGDQALAFLHMAAEEVLNPSLEYNLDPNVDKRQLSKKLRVAADVFSDLSTPPYEGYYRPFSLLELKSSPSTFHLGTPELQALERIEKAYLIRQATEESGRDSLTKLLSRRGIGRRLCEHFREMDRLKREGIVQSANNFTVFMIDLDRFKGVNDEFGHTYGDAVLICFAKTLIETSRATDIIGRWGGEEFVDILTPTTEQKPFDAKEKDLIIRKRFTENQIADPEVRIGIQKRVKSAFELFVGNTMKFPEIQNGSEMSVEQINTISSALEVFFDLWRNDPEKLTPKHYESIHAHFEDAGEILRQVSWETLLEMGEILSKGAFTFSNGCGKIPVSTLKRSADSVDDMQATLRQNVVEADNALIFSKETGRNKITIV
jgi:diguanylate cyclase (GGDEF)-like protein